MLELNTASTASVPQGPSRLSSPLGFLEHQHGCPSCIRLTCLSACQKKTTLQGRPYLCSSLDLHSRVAKVRAADVKYYTKLRDFTDVHVTGGRVAYRLGALAPLAPQLTSASDGESKLLDHGLVLPLSSATRTIQSDGLIFSHSSHLSQLQFPQSLRQGHTT